MLDWWLLTQLHACEFLHRQKGFPRTSSPTQAQMVAHLFDKDRCQVPGSVLPGVGIASQAPALGAAAHLKAAGGSGGGPADTGVRKAVCVCQGSLLPGASTELGFLKEK